MIEQPDTHDVSRRRILRTGAVASSATLFGGTVLAGNVAASNDSSFVYVPDGSVSNGDTVELLDRKGKEKVNCRAAGANANTEKFKVSNGDIWYFIDSRYDEDDCVKVTQDSGLADCDETGNKSGYREVGVTTVDCSD